MSQYPNPFSDARSAPLGYESRADSVTLVQFFNSVYAWMASGVALSAVVAWWVSTQPQVMRQVFAGPMLLVLFLVEIGLVMAISWAVNKISAGVATAMFMLYSALNGLTLSVIFLVYTNASLVTTFGVTAGTFAAMSIYGFVTKRDLTRFGSLLFMALIGLILATIVNIFWANSTLYWIITYAGVLIFVALTAYDTQMLKMIAIQTADNPALAARYAIVGALRLYLDFINLFLLLLRILGDRTSADKASTKSEAPSPRRIPSTKEKAPNESHPFGAFLFGFLEFVSDFVLRFSCFSRYAFAGAGSCRRSAWASPESGTGSALPPSATPIRMP
jgi:FtsH-binding integral membrane protein